MLEHTVCAGEDDSAEDANQRGGTFGDIITRLRAHRDVIGHVHVAGNPGRGELDGPQEINYPSVMRALLDIGYKGFVGQEFIPTRDPYQGLFDAVRLCDV